MKNEEGIFDKFIDKIYLEKESHDVTLATLNPSSAEFKNLSSVRLAKKLIVNTIYGAQGSSGSPLFTLPLAIAVTNTG